MKVSEREKIISEYNEAKALAAVAEKRIVELREEILLNIGAGQHGSWVVLVDEQERENLSIKDCKTHLTNTAFVQVSKLIKKIVYKTVKVSPL